MTALPATRTRRTSKHTLAHAAVGYARRSTDKQEQSIPDQQRAIERYCADNGLTIQRWFIDDAISGTRASNRPAFQEMLNAAGSSSRDFGSVVVYDVKRFGRLDNDEAGFYRHTLRQHGVEVLYVAEGFAGFGESCDTDDLLRPVKQWQARQESKDLSKVTIRGQLTKADTGSWMGGVSPHGYDLRYTNERGEFLFTIRFMPDGTKEQRGSDGRITRVLDRGEKMNISKRDRGQLVLGDPERVETIKTIFRLYTEERRGLSAVASYLNMHTIATPRGPGWSHIYCGKWRDSTVRSILVNPIYCGDMVWNRRTDARFHRIELVDGNGRPVERREVHGARLVPNDKNNWVVVRDTHEALIPRRTWEQAQSIRERKPSSVSQVHEVKKPTGGWSGMRSRFILSGLISCGRCGGRYQGVTRTKGKPRKDGTKIKNRYYGCGSYVAKGRSGCEMGLVKQDAIEHAVIRSVRDFYCKRYQEDSGLDLLAAAVRKHLGQETNDIAESRRRLDAEHDRIEANIAELLDNMSTDMRDMIQERLGVLRKERDDLKIRVGELERLALKADEVQDIVLELAQFIAGLELSLNQGVNDKRMAALRRCVTAIKLDKCSNAATIVLRELPLGSAVPTEVQPEHSVEIRLDT